MEIDAIALGELLVDFTPVDDSPQGNPTYEANPGGAPCNVLAMLSKLNKSTSFIGTVGKDIHGQMLIQALKDAGIGTYHLSVCGDAETTLAFVRLSNNGEREFSFYRRPGADTQIRPEKIDKTLFDNVGLFHFGSLSMTGQPSLIATQKAVLLAKESGCIISFDPNLRKSLWVSLEEARKQILWGCGECDILKLTQEELDFVRDGKSGENAVNLMKQFKNIRLLLVTDGEKGSKAYWKTFSVSVPAFLCEKVVDTTGAGDTFMGCCLAYILEHGLNDLSADDVESMLRFANAAAVLVISRKGSLRCMPDKEDIYVRQNRR